VPVATTLSDLVFLLLLLHSLFAEHQLQFQMLVATTLSDLIFLFLLLHSLFAEHQLQFQMLVATTPSDLVFLFLLLHSLFAKHQLKFRHPFWVTLDPLLLQLQANYMCVYVCAMYECMQVI